MNFLKLRHQNKEEYFTNIGKCWLWSVAVIDKPIPRTMQYGGFYHYQKELYRTVNTTLYIIENDVQSD